MGGAAQARKADACGGSRAQLLLLLLLPLPLPLLRAARRAPCAAHPWMPHCLRGLIMLCKAGRDDLKGAHTGACACAYVNPPTGPVRIHMLWFDSRATMHTRVCARTLQPALSLKTGS
eukprot:5910210-Pleurochrysis_carterae.AAC.1